MLVSQKLASEAPSRQGCLRTALAELQRRGEAPKRNRARLGTLAEPLPCEDGLRQCLLVLARRLARVQALGNEYARVDFSDEVAALLNGRVPVETAPKREGPRLGTPV